MRRRSLVLAISALALYPARLLAAPRVDAPGDARARARFAMSVGGIAVGRMDLQIDILAGELQLDVVNQGIAVWLSGRNRISMRTWLEQEREAIRPRRFEVRYAKPDRERSVAIDYAKDGRIDALEERHNGEPIRSRVPEEMWAGTVDPLTAFVRLQAWSMTAQGDDAIEIPIFEGRKRADLRVHRTATGELGAVLLARHGFDEDDSLVSWPDQPANRMAIATDPDVPSWPHRIATSSSMMPTVIELESLEALPD